MYKRIGNLTLRMKGVILKEGGFCAGDIRFNERNFRIAGWWWDMDKDSIWLSFIDSKPFAYVDDPLDFWSLAELGDKHIRKTLEMGCAIDDDAQYERWLERGDR
jgi:hypothetical protein